jgi:hypothetical protein
MLGVSLSESQLEQTPAHNVCWYADALDSSREDRACCGNY